MSIWKPCSSSVNEALENAYSAFRRTNTENSALEFGCEGSDTLLTERSVEKAEDIFPLFQLPSPYDHYSIDFDSMIQTNKHTFFSRSIRRKKKLFVSNDV